MDFLKACSTNVQTIANLHAIRYSVFALRSELIVEAHDRLNRAVAGLRQRDILCSASSSHLWIFEYPSVDLDELLESNDRAFVLQQDGVIQNDAPQDTSSSITRALDAIELGISFKLARWHTIRRIGKWQWLFSPAQADAQESSVLVHLHTHYENTGALQVAVTTSQASLYPIVHRVAKMGSSIVLAPGGSLAILAGPSLDTSSNTLHTKSFPMVPSDSWKAYVAAALRAEGVKLPDDTEWLALRKTDSSGSLLWPKELCFTLDHMNSNSHVDAESHDNWERWFDRAELENSRDPITFAEEWCRSTGDREIILTEARQQQHVTERPIVEDADAPDTITSDTAQVVGDPDLITSPPVLHRSGLQAIGGIYPTPPDGLGPAADSQHPLSSDSASVTQTRPDSNGMSGDWFRNSEDQPPLEPRDRGPSIASSIGPQPYQPHSDDLFGDLDNDFGGGVVDDVDFDFFDDNDQIESTQEHGDIDVVMQSQQIAPATQQDDQTEAYMYDAPAIGEPEPSFHVHESPAQDSQPPLEQQAPSTSHSSPGEDLSRLNVASPTPSDARFNAIKPLSPFGIKERLLPPPVPASIANRSSDDTTQHNSFGPIVFNPNLTLGSRLRLSQPDIHKHEGFDQPSSITTIPSHRRSAKRKPPKSSEHMPLSPHHDLNVEDESTDSSSDTSQELAPPVPPWQSLKRKRTLSIMELSRENSHSDTGSTDLNSHASTLLGILRGPSDLNGISLGSHFSHSRPKSATDLFPSLAQCFSEQQLEDLIMIAQVLGEQAITCIDVIEESLRVQPSDPFATSVQEALRNLITASLSDLMPTVKNCDVTTLALLKDTVVRSATAAGKNQPRPPQRSDANASGPDVFAIAAPYLCFRRADLAVEMMPPAVYFWEALTLSPSSGTKDIREFVVFPHEQSLQPRISSFLDLFKASYEGCKLGSFRVPTSPEMHVKSSWPVQIDEDISIPEIFQAYAGTCQELGEALAKVAHLERGSTFVLFLVNPFSCPTAKQHLCACFWLLYRAYRDMLTTLSKQQDTSDLVLQILPISLLCPPSTQPLPTAVQISTLAREIYDRCPPLKTPELTSALPITVAPSVDLASPLPKRIGFQLTEEPPVDLLHEGSVLHVAYARSQDAQWIAASWTDNTGRYQHNAVFCLQGLSYADIVADIWSRTLEIMAARSVSWRVFILTTSDIRLSESDCWDSLVRKHSPRQYLCNLTLVIVHSDPLLNIFASTHSDDTNQVSVSGAGFLTPVSTPSATNITVSPDASGHANAPPTPAPSEAVTEQDPDAHLVNLSDETWGILLDPKFNLVNQSAVPCEVPILAHGALIKRGDSSTSDQSRLPILSVGIGWTVRIRPNGAGVDAGIGKQAELTLKDLLGMYRGLGLLAKIRGVQRDGEEGMPIHLLSAIRAAAAVNSFLDSKPP